LIFTAMFLHKGQVLTFKGRDGAKRAADFADELNGTGLERAEAKGSTIMIKRDIEIGARAFRLPPPQPANGSSILEELSVRA
jgi:hypothetical protein